MQNKRTDQGVRHENNNDITETGDTFISVAYKPGEVTQKNVRLNSTLWYAEVIGTDKSGYSVRFHLPYFKEFSRGGFLSRQSALKYEQDIFDAHFADFLADDPTELCESVIA